MAQSHHTDPFLLQRISEGDEAAFAVLFHEYNAKLHPYLLRMIKSEALVEEIIQDVFTRIWLKRDQLPGIISIQAWIFRIASNECLNVLKHQLRVRKQEKQLVVAEARENTPLDLAERNELRQHVQEAIEQLSPQRKRIWRMSREQGMKHAEIASELNISQQTIKNTLAQAMGQIRTQLEEKGHLLSPGLLLYLCFY